MVKNFLSAKHHNPIFAVRKVTASLFSQGSLAQLVQSICLTSRGSAVRTRQLPQKVSKSEAFLF